MPNRHLTSRLNWMYTSTRPEPQTNQMCDIADFAYIGTRIKLHTLSMHQTAEVRALPYQDKDMKWWLPVTIIEMVGDIPSLSQRDVSLADYGVVARANGQWSRFNWIERV